MLPSACDIIQDEGGSIVIGWVEEGVLYARLSGGLSAPLGTKLVAHIQEALKRSESLQYFADFSSLAHYDLLARSAFVRLVLTNRRKFAAIVLLTWAEGISPAIRALAASIGDPIEIHTDPAQFDAKLLRVAPLAQRALPSIAPRKKAAHTSAGPVRKHSLRFKIPR